MILTTRMPKRVARELIKWTEVYMSPKSNSYYSVPYEMMYTCGAKRISDHWNINLNGGTFQTDKTVRNGDWTYAEYNGKHWVVKISLPANKNTTTVHNDDLPSTEEVREALKLKGAIR